MAETSVSYPELAWLSDKVSIPVNEGLLSIVSCETRTDLGYGLKTKFKFAKSLAHYYKVKTFDTSTGAITTDAPNGTYLLEYYNSTEDRLEIQQVTVTGGTATVDGANFEYWTKMSQKLTKTSAANNLVFNSDVSPFLTNGDKIGIGNRYVGKTAIVQAVSMANVTVDNSFTSSGNYDDDMPVWKKSVDAQPLTATNVEDLRLIAWNEDAQKWLAIGIKEQSATEYALYARIPFRKWKRSSDQKGVYWYEVEIISDNEWDNGRAVNFAYKAEDDKYPNPNSEDWEGVISKNTPPSRPKITKLEWNNADKTITVHFSDITANNKNPAFASGSGTYKIKLYNVAEILISGIQIVTSKWCRIFVNSSDIGSTVGVIDLKSGNEWQAEIKDTGIDIDETNRRTTDRIVDYTGLSYSDLKVYKKDSLVSTTSANPSDGSKTIMVSSARTYYVEVEATY